MDMFKQVHIVFFISEISALHYIYVYCYLMVFLLYSVVHVIVNIFHGSMEISLYLSRIELKVK